MNACCVEEVEAPSWGALGARAGRFIGHLRIRRTFDLQRPVALRGVLPLASDAVFAARWEALGVE
jgi:hypothetical protein